MGLARASWLDAVTQRAAQRGGGRTCATGSPRPPSCGSPCPTRSRSSPVVHRRSRRRPWRSWSPRVVLAGAALLVGSIAVGSLVGGGALERAGRRSRRSCRLVAAVAAASGPSWRALVRRVDGPHAGAATTAAGDRGRGARRGCRAHRRPCWPSTGTCASARGRARLTLAAREPTTAPGPARGVPVPRRSAGRPAGSRARLVCTSPAARRGARRTEASHEHADPGPDGGRLDRHRAHASSTATGRRRAVRARSASPARAGGSTGARRLA